MSQSPLDPEDPALAYKGAWSAISRLIREGHSWSGNEANRAFLGTGSMTFADVSAASGLDHSDDARAAVQVDWDLDGDLDLFVSARTAPRLRYLENQTVTRNKGLSLRLVGTDGNTDAIGARVRLIAGSHPGREPEASATGAPAQVTATRRAGAGFLAQSSGWMTLGCGQESSASVRVTWPNGDISLYEDLDPGRRYILIQGSKKARAASRPSADALAAVPDIPARPITKDQHIILAAPLPLPSLGVELVSGKPAKLFGVGPGGVGRALRAPLVVHVWASWCTPCVAELAETLAASQRFAAKGVDVLALSVDEGEARYSAHQLLQRLGWNYPQAYLTPAAAATLDALLASLVDRAEGLPLPTSLLLGKDGRVHAVYFGKVTPDRLLADIELTSLTPREHRRRAVPFEGSFLDPAGPPVVGPLAAALRRAGQGSAADELSQANVVVAQVDAAQVAMRVGEARVSQGRMDEARREFLRATEHDPDNPQAWVALGYCQQILEQNEDAVRSYQRALELDDDDLRTRFNLGLSLLATDELEAARQQVALIRRSDADLAQRLQGEIDRKQAAGDDD